MSTLFLDTSYNQVLGLLDNQGAWLARRELAGQKSSAELHRQLYELCPDAKTIQRVMYVAGPGFYTGLRIAYGIADILGKAGRELMSFYNYDVPRLLGIADYTWITKAYRGEVFIHTCRAGVGANRLVSEKEFLQQDWGGRLFIHHAQALDPQMAAKLPEAEATQALLLASMNALYPLVLSSPVLQELHYFRPPEEEFKPNP